MSKVLDLGLKVSDRAGVRQSKEWLFRTADIEFSGACALQDVNGGH
ncbi:MAG: hypothetical protein WBV36_12495 [Terriglobales bacterium]